MPTFIAGQTIEISIQNLKTHAKSQCLSGQNALRSLEVLLEFANNDLTALIQPPRICFDNADMLFHFNHILEAIQQSAKQRSIGQHLKLHDIQKQLTGALTPPPPSAAIANALSKLCLWSQTLLPERHTLPFNGSLKTSTHAKSD